MSSDKVHVNLAVIGHKGAGKSTLIGHLASKLGGLDPGMLAKLEAEAKAMGKGAESKYAWVVDRSKTERERGTSIDLSRLSMETKKFHFSVTNTPGDRKYVKNMATGVSQADVAILVVSVAEGFPDPLQDDTLTLATFASFLRARLIVCVNKLDKPSWSELHFRDVRPALVSILRKTHSGEVPIIPISGLAGDNLVERSSKTPWYTGPTLVEALDALAAPKRPVEKPLRMPVQDVYRIGGDTVVVGRLTSGVMRPGMTVEVAPQQAMTLVKSIEMHHQPVKLASAGDAVGCMWTDRWLDVGRGAVVGDAKNDPPKMVTKFIAQVVVLHHPNKIEAGYTPMIHCHTARFPCKFEKLLCTVGRAGVLEESPESIKEGQTALVDMVPSKPVTLEAHDEYPQLGRFVVRDGDRTVAVGTVMMTVRERTELGSGSERKIRHEIRGKLPSPVKHFCYVERERAIEREREWREASARREKERKEKEIKDRKASEIHKWMAMGVNPFIIKEHIEAYKRQYGGRFP